MTTVSLQAVRDLLASDTVVKAREVAWMGRVKMAPIDDPDFLAVLLMADPVELGQKNHTSRHLEFDVMYGWFCVIRFIRAMDSCLGTITGQVQLPVTLACARRLEDRGWLGPTDQHEHRGHRNYRALNSYGKGLVEQMLRQPA